jgi:hypothetical protein
MIPEKWNRFSARIMPKKRVRIVLRYKVLVSVIPLIAAAILARIEFFPADRPCIAVATGTVQLATAPWHADLQVSFTDDPGLATVRVAVSDNAATADFAVIDGADTIEENACAATAATQFVAISSRHSGFSPVTSCRMTTARPTIASSCSRRASPSATPPP